MDRAWAWTFWETEYTPGPQEREVHVSQILVKHLRYKFHIFYRKVVVKATDSSYNVQPESVKGIWNLR